MAGDSNPSAIVNVESIDLMEDDEDDVDAPGIVLEVKMGSPRGFYYMDKVFGSASANGTLAWCPVSNLVACSTSTSIPNSRPRGNSRFCIPISVVDPERPTEHFVIRVPVDGPMESLHTLAWSPLGCVRALITVTSNGKSMIWTQPNQGGPNVARAIDTWQCEAEWNQDPPLLVKWLHGTPLYPWPPTAPDSGKTYEERFFSREPRRATRWPRGSFLCVCTVFRCGSLQLRWRDWPSSSNRSDSATWHASLVTPFCTDPILAADVAVTSNGKVILASVSVSAVWTVVLWEIHPGEVKPQGIQISQRPAEMMPGMAPMAAFLTGWTREEKKKKEGEGERGDGKGEIVSLQGGPSLVCVSLSFLSACGIANQGGRGSKFLDGRIVDVALDPCHPNLSVFTLVAEGGDASCPPSGYPTSEKFLWRLQRWESSKKLALHPVFEGLSGGGGSTTGNPSSPQPMFTTWNPVSVQEYGGSRRSRDGNSVKGEKLSLKEAGTTINSSLSAHLEISPLCNELAVSLPGGEIHVLVGSSLSPLRSSYMKLSESVVVPLAFSPTSCCLGVTSYNFLEPSQTSLRILRVPNLEPNLGKGNHGGTATWERHLADRLEWSWVSGAHWWDAVACAQSAQDEGIGTVAGFLALLDSDFHSQAQQYRAHYAPILDRVKVRALEGVEGQEIRALCLDLQARLLLDSLGRSIEACLVVPGTLMVCSGISSSEALPQLGPDAMVVEPSLIPIAHAYVDALLDLTSHFLTRLRRYFSLYKSLAGGGGAPGASPNQGNQTNGPNKVTKSPNGESPQNPNSAAGSNTNPNLQLSMPSARTMPAVQLVGDRHFLHKLCSLACFALVCRRRSPPPPPNGGGSSGPMNQRNPSEGERGRSTVVRLGNGNGGLGYTADEVKVMFLSLNELCRKTHSLPSTPPPPPSSQGNTPVIRLHYADGQMTIPPDQLESWMHPHMQQFPRPRGADAAGLLVRELELSPPAEDALRKSPTMAPVTSDSSQALSIDYGEMSFSKASPGNNKGLLSMWPRKRRFAERNAALGLVSAAGLGDFFGFLGARRDVLTGTWRNSPEATWHKCMRCGRQTASLTSGSRTDGGHEEDNVAISGNRELLWPSWWVRACPICGGQWARVV